MTWFMCRGTEEEVRYTHTQHTHSQTQQNIPPILTEMAIVFSSFYLYFDFIHKNDFRRSISLWVHSNFHFWFTGRRQGERKPNAKMTKRRNERRPKSFITVRSRVCVFHKYTYNLSHARAAHYNYRALDNAYVKHRIIKYIIEKDKIRKRDTRHSQRK